MTPSSSGPTDLGPGLDLRPLTARSVILSLLLGSHPPRLPVRTLVRVAELFGISDGTVRVALSRMANDGDLRTEDGVYELSDRLLERQRRQDEGRRPPERSWAGWWEVAVVRRAGRHDVDTALRELHLAELAARTWLRPDNLERTWPPDVAGRCHRFTARPTGDPSALASELWDLAGWAAHGRALLSAMAVAGSPARRFTVAAALLRHLRRDPMLPASLLPGEWPGDRLRTAYREFEAELRAFLDDAAG